MLLPVATRAEVDLTLSRVLPGLDLAASRAALATAARPLAALVRLLDPALRLG